MNHLFRPLLLVVLFALPLGAQEVKLPAEVQVLPGAWAIVSPEVVSGGKPKWRVDPALTEVRLDLLFPPEIAKQATGRVFTSVTPGRFRVECWNAKGDVPSDIAVTWVNVIGSVPVPPGPTPNPLPVPPAPIPAGIRDILILRESALSTPETAAMIRNLRDQRSLPAKYIKDKQYNLFILDVDSLGEDGKPSPIIESYRPLITGKTLPVVVLLSPPIMATGSAPRGPPSVVAVKELPASATAEDVITLLKGFGG